MARTSYFPLFSCETEEVRQRREEGMNSLLTSETLFRLNHIFFVGASRGKLHFILPECRLDAMTS